MYSTNEKLNFSKSFIVTPKKDIIANKILNTSSSVKELRYDLDTSRYHLDLNATQKSFSTFSLN